MAKPNAPIHEQFDGDEEPTGTEVFDKLNEMIDESGGFQAHTPESLAKLIFG